MTLAFVHITATRNTGDLMSGPHRWFDFPAHTFHDYSAPLPVSASTVIYGGGALTGWLRGRISRGETRIAWGVGSTRRDATEPYPDPLGFDLLGIRDWSAEREAAGRYLPCASCMSPLFDRDWPVTREAVAFVNADATKPRPAVDLPRLDNAAPMEEIVAFLGSAEVVVTNSYHGAYWATLLQRRVVCVPYSSKFHGFSHPPAMSPDGRDWRALAQRQPRYVGVLDEARALNRAFYARVMDLIA